MRQETAYLLELTGFDVVDLYSNLRDHQLIMVGSSFGSRVQDDGLTPAVGETAEIIAARLVNAVDIADEVARFLNGQAERQASNRHIGLIESLVNRADREEARAPLLPCGNCGEFI